MPNRELTDGLPAISSLTNEQEILAIRAAIKKLRVPQGYKWRLSVRLRQVRMKAAGEISILAVRQWIADAGHICPACNSDMRYWISRRFPTIDHIIPLAKGGTNERANLRVICNRCNSGKRDAYPSVT